MKNFLYFSILAWATTLISCTKEIELDYHDIEPVPVIEGLLSADRTEVRITRTRNMDDSVKSAGIEVDRVEIISANGLATTLNYQSDGFYRPASAITLNDGETYTLRVTMDGVTYTGESTLQPAIQITEPEFLWANLMDWMQVMEFETINVADDAEVYGWIRIYRNRELYFADVGRIKGNSPIDIGLYYDSDMELDEEMILYNGDTLALEVRTIDLDVYNYLAEYNSTKMNPEQFFTPSVEGKVCLGYFAAYSSVSHEIIYRKTPHE